MKSTEHILLFPHFHDFPLLSFCRQVAGACTSDNSSKLRSAVLVEDIPCLHGKAQHTKQRIFDNTPQGQTVINQF